MAVGIDEPAALDTTRAFTRADAISAGISPKMLRGSRFRRLFRGVYISASVPRSPLHRVSGALLLHPPGAVATHLSAARVYRVPVPDLPDEHVSVFDPRDRRPHDGIRCHVAAPGTRVLRVRGVDVQDPFSMFVALASVLSLVDLVVVGDALVRMYDIAPGRLVAECEASSDRHVAAARRAAAYVREGVDSVMETRLRMLIVLAGLPEPQVNHQLREESGAVVRRLDLSYPLIRLIIEYDGRQHAESTRQWNSDLVRREEFDDGDWKILVVTAKGIYTEPAETVGRIHRALVTRGYPAVPARLAEGWRAHFPGRG
ncbi:MAG: hypothetical protein ACRDPB_09430 [Nocardioidaceae bacterium]